MALWAAFSAFLNLPPEDQAKHAADARFAGVFRYLARAMRPDQAIHLRERLIRKAAEIDDHRVSDEFIREYDWRLRFSGNMPDWVSHYDSAETRQAEVLLKTHLANRNSIDAAIETARAEITARRKITSILTATDPQELLDRITSMITALGAQITAGAAAIPLVSPPGYEQFSVAALAQPNEIARLHVDLLLPRLVALPRRRLLVTNSNGLLDPANRPDDLSSDDQQRIRAAGIAWLQAKVLHAMFVAANGKAPPFWERLSQRWS